MKEITSLKKLAKFETEIFLKIPWEQIKENYEQIFSQVSKNLSVKGFRQGKAPKKIVEENIDKTKIYSQVLTEILPKFYEKIIRENNLNPIINPKISIVSAKEDSDWEIKIIICERPTVNLGNYIEEIGKLNKTEKIWLPGKETKNEPEDKQKSKEERIQKSLKWLAENVSLQISDLIIEEELNRKLANLISETQKLGLTVEQYLASTGKTAEVVKEEYKKQAQDSWKMELILDKIADSEAITVEGKEIDDLVSQAKSEEEKKALGSQKYFLASIVRRQKTLDFLASL